MTSNISIVTFSQLKSENLRLKNELNFTNKCLDILIKFKNNLIDILNERSYSSVVYLKSDNIKVFEDLNNEYNILAQNPEFGIKNKTNDLKTIDCKRLKKDKESKQLSENQNMIKIISFESNKSNERQMNPNINQLKPNIKTYSKQKPMTTTTNNPIQRVLMSVISTQKECHNVKIALKCSIYSCHQIFYSELDLKEHIQRVHNKRFIKCVINFDPKSESRAQPLLLQPLSQNKSISKNNNLNKYKCGYDLCEKCFPSKFLLNHHILYVHKNVRPFKCDFPNCNKSFRRKSTQMAHMICHSNDKPFECNFKDCKYRAKTKFRLITHLNMTHNDFRPFDCDVNGCALKFKTYACLQSHVSHKHSNEASVKCTFNDCQKLVRPHKMKEHLRYHKMQPIPCIWSECQYTTKRKGSMDKHITQTHSSERNYVCDWPQCGKRFKTNSYLRLHSRSHSNEKPYTCDWPECDFKAISSQYLKRHLRTHTKEKPYPCQWPGCEYRCSFGPNLKKHMKVHTKC